MSAEPATTSTSTPAGVPSPNAATAIAVEGLSKTFRIPTHRVDSLKERMVRPFAARDYRVHRALDDVSFEIREGEFFGIVGRNGSGKSTLLKLLASIYRADSGRIRIAGRLAPFIELGVGFNLELTARENVVLNGVMMGLTPTEMRNRLDAVIEFAELEEFADLKLKNYSSGMLVRLAFSVMMEADADVLLIDEVLAVGDASFQQKCDDAFREMKAAGKTIVLVTHDMATVESFCHRAMLIAGGRIQHFGDPAEVGREYLRLNFEEEGGGEERTVSEQTDEVALLDARVENAAGERLRNIEHGEPIRLRFEFEAERDLAGIKLGFLVTNSEGVGIYNFGTQVEGGRELSAGERVTVRAELENRLIAGRYFVHCGVYRAAEGGIALYVTRAIEFHVFGGPQNSGMVQPELRISARVDEEQK